MNTLAFALVLLIPWVALAGNTQLIPGTSTVETTRGYTSGSGLLTRVWIPASAMIPDADGSGSQCVKTTAQYNSGPFLETITCDDSDVADVWWTWKAPGRIKHDSAMYEIRTWAFSVNATPSNSWRHEFSCARRGGGEAAVGGELINATLVTAANASTSFDTQWRVVNSDNGSLSGLHLHPNDLVYCRLRTSATLTTTQMADVRLLGMSFAYYAGSYADQTDNVQLASTVTVSTLSNATPIVVTTSTSHGYASGDAVFLDGTSITALNDTVHYITVTGSTTFTLNGSTAAGAGTGGTVQRVTYPVGLP